MRTRAKPNPIGRAARTGPVIDGKQATPAEARVAAKEARQKQMQQLIDTLELDERSKHFSGGLDVVARKVRVLRCLVASLNIVTTACANAGIGTVTFYEYKKTDSEFAKVVTLLSSYTDDFMEQKLFNLISEGDTAATIFYAKTKLKGRGYVERHELTGPNGGPMSLLHMNMADIRQDLPEADLASIYAALLASTGQSPDGSRNAATLFAKGRGVAPTPSTDEDHEQPKPPAKQPRARVTSR